VGLSCKIRPHNFPRELLEPQSPSSKAVVQSAADFQTGGMMDARDDRDGAGSIKVRAKNQSQR